MKRILFVFVLGLFAACNSTSSAEATTDSTVKVIDSQKSATKDSVIKKADSNKQFIDSSFNAMKDSVKNQ